MLQVKIAFAKKTHYLLSLLPFRVLYALSDFIYILVYHVIGYRKKVTRNNLERSFPEKTKQEIIALEKKFYHYFCDYIVETNKLFSLSEKQSKQHLTMSGIDEMEKEFSEKDFVFLCMGHYANWEWFASIPLWLKNKETFVGSGYQPLKSRTYDQIFLDLRGKFGLQGIASKDLLRKIISMRKEKRKGIIMFISDQAPSLIGAHCWTNFLHQDTAFFTGAESIGRKQNAAFYFTEITRPKRGYYHVNFVKIAADITKKNEVTKKYAEMLEQMIIRQPELWLWTHRRWKRDRSYYGDSTEQ